MAYFFCVCLTIISTTLFIFVQPLIPSIIAGIASSIFFAVKRPIIIVIVDPPELVYYTNFICLIGCRVLDLEFSKLLKLFWFYYFLSV